MKLLQFVLLCVASVCVLNQASAQKAEQPQKPVPLPESVRHIPPDATFFFHVRVADVEASELGKRLLRRELWDEKTEKFFAEHAGIGAKDLEALTLLFLPTPAEWDKVDNVFELGQLIEPDIFTESFLLTTAKPYDRAKVVRGLQSEQSAKVLGENVTVLFLSDHTIMLGSKANIRRFTDLQKRKESTLPRSEALKLAAEKQHIVLGAHLSPAMQRMIKGTIEINTLLEPWLKRKEAKEPAPKSKGSAINEATFAPLLNLRSGAVAIQLTKDVEIRMQVAGKDKSEVDLALQSLKTLIAVSVVQCQDLEKSDDVLHKQIGKGLRVALEKASLEQERESIRFRATVQLDATLSDAIARYYERLGKDEKRDKDK